MPHPLPKCPPPQPQARGSEERTQPATETESPLPPKVLHNPLHPRLLLLPRSTTRNAPKRNAHAIAAAVAKSGRHILPLAHTSHLIRRRCDVLIDSDPPLCQHCKQYGFECTFFLPITETRFKKKKLEEDPPAEKEKDRPADPQQSTASSQTDTQVDRSVYGLLYSHYRTRT